jgi:hypothetical protein
MPAFQFAELARPIAVICNDAGAANIVFYGLQGTPGPIQVWATGPAAGIAAACGLPTNVESLEAALNGAWTLLSGTGWASDIEHAARRLARMRGIPSIAVLDHWVNYPQRFSRDGTEILPNRWWVTDAFALAEAERHFPRDRIDLVPNRYVAAQLARITPVGDIVGNVLLYVLEPARSDWGADVQGEFQALDYFVTNLRRLSLPADLIIRLRPHPSDVPGKYDDWMARQSGLTLELDTAPDMAAALGDAKWVAGCESFGLALALDAGRTVFCTLPSNAPLCRLPHDKLIHIRAME